MSGTKRATVIAVVPILAAFALCALSWAGPKRSDDREFVRKAIKIGDKIEDVKALLATRRIRWYYDGDEGILRFRIDRKSGLFLSPIIKSTCAVVSFTDGRVVKVETTVGFTGP